jgi:hypothetical protein
MRILREEAKAAAVRIPMAMATATVRMPRRSS